MAASHHLIVAAAMLALAGCAGAPPNYEAPDAPRYDAAIRERCGSPCVALVLGSGGPRGFAHVGVLKVLEREGLKPGMIVGASVGALIGSIYATGISAVKLEEFACEIDATKFLRFSGFGIRGDGLALEAFVNETVGGKPLEALGAPIAIVAMREFDHEPEVFTAGNTGVAVRASAAIPRAFPVATIRGVRYVDGDEWTPVPIRIARALGADIVIAVDVSAHIDKTPSGAPDDWRAKDEFRAGQIRSERPFADVFIHPDLGYYASMSTAYRRRSIALAERATEVLLPQIRAAWRKR
ncbi:MAG: patatin-like phospholipase family protein [Burkholderiales bacterium]